MKPWQHRRLAKRKKEKEAKEQMIKDANIKHDIEHNLNAVSSNYDKEYIQGTGMRNSK
jgi:hypothetical protein